MPRPEGAERTGVERRYVLTRLGAGDYLLPSNDGRTLWRIRRYTEGPSTGLDWPRDREVWGIWRWVHRIEGGGQGQFLDPDDNDSWEFREGMCETRSEAIDAALRLA